MTPGMPILTDWAAVAGVAKPILTALLLPPAGPLLALLPGLLLIWRRRPNVSWSGRLWIAAALVALWTLSCQSTAVALGRHLLPSHAPASVQMLRQQQVQAVVVLGGGIEPYAPEYGGPQLNALSMERLRYGVWLARELQVPLAFAGGVGWSQAAHAAGQPPVPAEADMAGSVALQVLGHPIAIIDSRSRDTRENGLYMTELLLQRNIRHIALVTHAWHMPRAMRAFDGRGLQVHAAPMGFTGLYERPLLGALPSAHGLTASRRILREWLGLLLGA